MLSDWSPIARSDRHLAVAIIPLRQMLLNYALRFALLCFQIFFVVKLHRRVDEALMFSSPSVASIYVPRRGYLKVGSIVQATCRSLLAAHAPAGPPIPIQKIAWLGTCGVVAYNQVWPRYRTTRGFRAGIQFLVVLVPNKVNFTPNMPVGP